MGSLKSLNTYFLKHKLLLFLGALFVIASNYFGSAYVPYVSDSVNKIAETMHTSLDASGKETFKSVILKNIIIIIVFHILYGIFRFFMRQCIIVTSRKIEFELKNNIYNQYQRLSYSYLKQSKIGDLMNRLSEDLVWVRQYLGPGLMYAINLSSNILIVVVFMLKTDVKLTLYTLIPLPILSYVVYRLSEVISVKTTRMQESQAEISSLAQDSFSGIRVIKSFGKEEHISDLYTRKANNYYSKAMSLQKTNALFSPIAIVVIGLSNLAILYIGGREYIEGRIDAGTITSFFLYLNTLIWPFMSIGWVISIVRQAEGAMNRINVFFEVPEEIVNTNNEEYKINGDIRFENISYTYQNTGIQALKDVSFEVKTGESIALMGKTGSGKSTIGILLARLVEPDTGTIYIDNKPLKEHNIKMLRKYIGVVPQESFLFSESIKDNIAYGEPESSQEEVEQYAKQAEIHDSILGFTHGYDTVLGERGVTLSGGQKQRVSIARALIRKPAIFLFDDSLSALDNETEQRILANIDAHEEKTTSLIITHRIASTQNADKIITLAEGKIIENGSHAELIAKGGEYADLYNKQIEKKEEI